MLCHALGIVDECCSVTFKGTPWRSMARASLGTVHSQDWPVTQPSGVLGPGHFCPSSEGPLPWGCPGGWPVTFSELPGVSDPFFLIPLPRPSPAVGPPSLSCPPVPCHFLAPHKCPTYPALSWCLLPRVQKHALWSPCVPRHGFVCNFGK